MIKLPLKTENILQWIALITVAFSLIGFFYTKYFTEVSSLKAENESLKKSLENLPTITAERDELKDRFDNIIRLDTSDHPAEEIAFAQPSMVEVPEGILEQENDRTKVLRYFYEGNYKGVSEEVALDKIVAYTKLPRPKVKVIFSRLVKEGILKPDRFEQYQLTDAGNNKLLELFDKTEELI